MFGNGQMMNDSTMTLQGHIKNGIAIIDGPVRLPDGTRVDISVREEDAGFWSGKSIGELAKEQGVSPAVDVISLAGDWPADESVDDFLQEIRSGRR
jgi:hypothetical protein